MSFFIYLLIAVGLILIFFGVLTFSIGEDKPIQVDFDTSAAKELFKIAKDNNPVGVTVTP